MCELPVPRPVSVADLHEATRVFRRVARWAGDGELDPADRQLVETAATFWDAFADSHRLRLRPAEEAVRA